MPVVALEQIEAPPGAVEQNEAQILLRARTALEAGAQIVVFPELANSGYVVDADVVRQTAQTLDGPFVTRLQELAAEHRGLITSGFCERAGGDFFNSVAVVGPDGPVLHYRKVHLFDREHEVFTGGNELPVVDTEHGRIGVCVCYDLRFVEVLRALALQGADLVLAPAAWTGGFDPSVPATGVTRQAEAVVVQANLDQVAVVAVSQVGGAPGGGGVRTLGGSLAVDAFGDVVCGPLSRTAPESALVRIDVEAGRSARVRGDRIRPREDRRVDIYGLKLGEEIL
jgi:N-carbamoylputrescine amidase